MFFVLQKIIWFLIVPPASLLLLILAGAVVIKRHPRTGRLLIFAGLLFLYLLSLGPVADVILRPLEQATPPLREEQAAADAVVVPGGGSVDLEWMGAGAVPNAETLSRLVTGVRIAKKLHVPLVLCGGNGEPFATKVRDADAMETVAIEMGMDPKQLIVERESRNTLENSHAVRKLVAGNRIVLATSAYYMRRARAMFEKRGFAVIPAATDHLVQTRRYTASVLIPGASHLQRSTVGIAEWFGMAWWSLRGEM